MAKRHPSQPAFDFLGPTAMPAHCVRSGAPPVAHGSIQPRDPSTDERDVPRLSGQNGEILRLLQSKPEVTNAELSAISLKYTGRLSDIRRYGYIVNARRGNDGLWFYSLGEAEAS